MLLLFLVSFFAHAQKGNFVDQCRSAFSPNDEIRRLELMVKDKRVHVKQIFIQIELIKKIEIENHISEFEKYKLLKAFGFLSERFDEFSSTDLTNFLYLYRSFGKEPDNRLKRKWKDYAERKGAIEL